MNIISWIMLIFAILGGIDFLLGNRFGLGKEFEKGFKILGNMVLAMVGAISLAPLLAEVLAPCFDWVFTNLHLDPSIIPASLFANDMGGAPLASQIAKDSNLGLYNALVVTSMMGTAISFNIPYALGIVNKDKHKDMFFGMLCGIATIPVGCIVSGLMCGINILSLLINLLPIAVIAVVIALGLIFASKITIKIFSLFGIFMKSAILIAFLTGVFQNLTGIVFVNGLGDINEGVLTCFNIAVILSGAFPFMFIISKLFAKPIEKLGKLLGIESEAAMGLLGTLVTDATTFEAMNRMSKKGVVLNSAFLISAAFILGSHLAFTIAFDSTYLPAVLIGKFISGVCALILAAVLFNRVYSKENKIEIKTKD